MGSDTPISSEVPRASGHGVMASISSTGVVRLNLLGASGMFFLKKTRCSTCVFDSHSVVFEKVVVFPNITRHQVRYRSFECCDNSDLAWLALTFFYVWFIINIARQGCFWR